MELQIHFDNYVNQLRQEFEIPPFPQISLIYSTVKNWSGDLSVYMNQPSTEPLKPHIHRLISDVPRASKLWPLQISRVELKPQSPYLELYLTRPRAFEYLCQNIVEVHSGIAVCGSTVSGGKRLLLVNGPGQNEFDGKRSSLLLNYVRILSRFSGFECTTYEEGGRQDGSREIDREEWMTCPYYDESRRCFDLPKFIRDRQFTGDVDPSIAVVYETSPLLEYALQLRHYLSMAPKDLVCHVVPHGKSVSQLQIGLLLMILGCRANQSFLVHGGVDGGSSCMEEHEKQIGIYVSNQLRQKQVPGNESVGQTLKETKLAFDFLRVKQQSRMKSPNVRQEGSESTSFEGKGGLFVQYTCSRLSGLIRNYDRAIIIEAYPGRTFSDELLGENLDWALLQSDLEWNLCKTMMRFLDLLRSLKKAIPCDDNISRIDVKANSVCEGLMSLCREFSVYYSKVRILVDGQAHTFPTIECRIYFMRMLLCLIECGLWLLGLEPVECM